MHHFFMFDKKYAQNAPRWVFYPCVGQNPKLLSLCGSKSKTPKNCIFNVQLYMHCITTEDSALLGGGGFHMNSDICALKGGI